MAERTNARLLKSREVQASGGSNPPPSAVQGLFLEFIGPERNEIQLMVAPLDQRRYIPFRAPESR
jgi:hypothetical protein